MVRMVAAPLLNAPGACYVLHWFHLSKSWKKKGVELGCDQPRVENLGFQHLDRLELFLLVDFKKSMISADVKCGRCATDSH